MQVRPAEHSAKRRRRFSVADVAGREDQRVGTGDQVCLIESDRPLTVSHLGLSEDQHSEENEHHRQSPAPTMSGGIPTREAAVHKQVDANSDRPVIHDALVVVVVSEGKVVSSTR